MKNNQELIDLKIQYKELKEKFKVLEAIKSDWIDSQLSDKKFPQDYIEGKKEINEIREYYDRQIREQANLLTLSTDKYFKLLIECNAKFKEIQELKKEIVNEGDKRV